MQEGKEEEEMEVNTLIFLVTGDGVDPYGTRSMLSARYNNAPDYILSFIGWLSTPPVEWQQTMDFIAIEASPIPGRIYVNGQLTDNDLTKLFLVITTRKKQSYHYWSIGGGLDEFFFVFFANLFNVDQKHNYNRSTL